MYDIKTMRQNQWGKYRNVASTNPFLERGNVRARVRQLAS